MRLFIELLKRSLQRQFAYRAAVFAGLVTNLFFGVLRVSVMQALYGQRTDMAGISIQGAITFTGVSQAIIGALSIFSWFLVIDSVHSGEIASDLLKPMNYFTFWMAQDLGAALVQFTLRSLPIMLLYALFFDIAYPTSPLQWLALALSLALAWMISFSFRFLVNLAAFWTPNARGIGRFFFVMSWFLSGFLMPLRFFPDWFVRLCNLTPFPYMINTVIEVYLGVLSGPALLQALLGQVVWVVILLAACRLVLQAGIRRLVILGG